MDELDRARVALYNAAVAHSGYITSDTTDFKRAMEVSRALEEAAVKFTRALDVQRGTSGPG